MSNRKAVEGSDVVIMADIFLPGHQPFRAEIKLHDYAGNTLASSRTPTRFLAGLYEGLRKQFGVKVT